MSESIINDELLLKIAKEELTQYVQDYSNYGLVLGNCYMDKVNAIYELLVKIYGKPFLAEHGIEILEDEDDDDEEE